MMWRRFLRTAFEQPFCAWRSVVHIPYGGTVDEQVTFVKSEIRSLPQQRRRPVRMATYRHMENDSPNMKMETTAVSMGVQQDGVFKQEQSSRHSFENAKEQEQQQQHPQEKDMAVHDPATVVTLDSRRRKLHLSPVQRELVWNARRREYQQLLVRIVTCLESHLAPIEKCHALLALHEEVIVKRIRLRVDTYEDIFHVFYAVATLGTSAPALAEEDVVDRHLTSSSSLLPTEFANATVAASSLLAGPLLQSLWSMYRYMIDSGTNPTPRVVQYVMGILERYSKKDAIVEARAHSLMMDLDRFHLTPTEYTIAAYIGVCDWNGVMHLAVARVTDYRTRHERQASAGIYARLLFGLIHNHQYDEALSCMTTIDSVAVTPHLLNAVLNTARHSRDPLSAFTLYKSVMGRQGNSIAPNSHTISILLESMRSTGCYDEVDFLLREMRRFRVKGNSRTLNKLLEVFLKLGRNKEAIALFKTMDNKGVVVFDEFRRKCEERLSSSC
ncbi:uncharacterized protein TM35_000261830 [Trypanosoma theileri]|uniref:Uncharacterized protein n=1 Tax=Trypanosoma theileri TaxID=67003 RepID=A0A1X0NQ51_9TRYP|nr:uncharacterized protein TM35_000261830 [Trypanosoma theileri]ORC86731.1 hypothetical protein TM35_000261830 [Trypanosoma theileri]